MALVLFTTVKLALQLWQTFTRVPKASQMAAGNGHVLFVLHITPVIYTQCYLSEFCRTKSCSFR